MQDDGTHDDTKVRDAMGDQGIHGEAAQQVHPEEGASYSVVRYPAAKLPAQYLNLILSRWKRSLRHGNDYYKLIATDSYFAAYDWYLTRLLAEPGSTIRLAVLAKDPDVVLGFSVCRGDVLDYVHVHKDQRRLGIGSRLVPDDVAIVSHLTRTGLTIWGSKYPQWKFNPFV